MITRRKVVQDVLSVVGLLTASRVRAKTISQDGLVGDGRSDKENEVSAPLPSDNTRLRSLKIRHQCALFQNQRSIPEHINNGDEKLLPRWTGNFTKGLPHAQTGEVEPGCYESLLKALETEDSEAFQKIMRGSGMRFVNPQAAFSIHLEGGDAQTFACPPAPSVTSAGGAAEVVELYWHALTRDVPFAQYEQSPVIEKAAEDLNRLTGFAGPKERGRITPGTIFRGSTLGSLTGPYVSQFLWQTIPAGVTTQEQRYRWPAPGNDFLNTYSEWLQLQTGVPPWREYRWESDRSYLMTGRDLAEYAHYDFLYQAFLSAALILMEPTPAGILRTSYYLSETNPYKHSKIMAGFVTFGFANIADWIGRVTTAALKAAWYQKWLVHRRLRPEEFGGLIHRTKTGMADYPVHREAPDSIALEETHRRFGSYLLPQAYPEGCPLHPAYPSGHATVSGACATILKAFFDENLVVPDCVNASSDGKSLVPYQGRALTVKSEVEKLAFNIAMGRNFAGIHYRSDATAGIQLGEEVAITILQDLVNTFAEDFPGFQFTRFDGTPVHITKMA
jgi:hypothetical protein